MKQITCEMCGDNDLIKTDGVFVCQSCGTKYSLEEAKKMLVEGTVIVEGTVKVDTSDQLNNLIKNAMGTYEDGQYYEAAKLFSHVLSIQADNEVAVLYRGLADGRQDLKNCKLKKVGSSTERSLKISFGKYAEGKEFFQFADDALNQFANLCSHMRSENWFNYDQDNEYYENFLEDTDEGADTIFMALFNLCKDCSNASESFFGNLNRVYQCMSDDNYNKVSIKIKDNPSSIKLRYEKIETLKKETSPEEWKDLFPEDFNEITPEGIYNRMKDLRQEQEFIIRNQCRLLCIHDFSSIILSGMSEEHIILSENSEPHFLAYKGVEFQENFLLFPIMKARIKSKMFDYFLLTFEFDYSGDQSNEMDAFIVQRAAKVRQVSQTRYQLVEKGFIIIC